MKNLSLSLLAVLTLATVTPAFADEIGPGFCLDPELCRSTMTMSSPTVVEPEEEATHSDEEASLTDYMVQLFTL